jgi:hypothetical protein
MNHSNVTAVDVPYCAAYRNGKLVLTVARSTSDYFVPVVRGGTQGTDVLDVQ